MKDEHIRSAIIGYWRMGASLTEIKEVTEIPISVIIKIVNDYEKNINTLQKES